MRARMEGTAPLPDPTDAALETDTDVYDEALPIDRVLVSNEHCKQFRLVLIDACRDNPAVCEDDAARRGLARDPGAGFAEGEF